MVSLQTNKIQRQGSDNHLVEVTDGVGGMDCILTEFLEGWLLGSNSGHIKLKTL